MIKDTRCDNILLSEGYMEDFTIYCDLDGVLVDLAGAMSKIFGENLKNNKFSDKLHELMNKLSVSERFDFWKNLDETHDCMELWNFIKQFDPFILTSCSGITIACMGKKDWCKNHIDVDPHKVICVPHSDRKQHYAGPNKILIDDLESNINEWDAKGGIGILHENAKDTIKLLKNILYTKYDTYDI